MSRSRGIKLGLCALLPGIAVGMTFAAGVNLHYDVHPVFFVGTAIALALTWLFGRASLRAFGVAPRTAVMTPLVVAFVWTVAFFVLTWSTFPDSATAARKNNAVLQAIPVYPGFRLYDESTNRHVEGDLAAEGFISPPYFETIWKWSGRTNASTRVVADWYSERLRRENWSVQRGTAGDGWIMVEAKRAGTNVELIVMPSQASLDAGLPVAVEVDGSTGF